MSALPRTDAHSISLSLFLFLILRITRMLCASYAAVSRRRHLTSSMRHTYTHKVRVRERKRKYIKSHVRTSISSYLMSFFALSSSLLSSKLGIVRIASTSDGIQLDGTHMPTFWYRMHAHSEREHTQIYPVVVPILRSVYTRCMYEIYDERD